MKKLLAIALIVLSFSCTPSGEKENDHRARQDTVVFTHYDYSSPNVEIKTRKTVLIQQQAPNGSHTLKYYYLDEENQFLDTLIYQFPPKDNWIRKGSDSVAITAVDTLYVKLKGEMYRVYKYAIGFNRIDGCSTHFWVPQLGVILIRSTTWRNFQKASMPADPSRNKIMEHLQNVVFQRKEFYFGCESEKR